MDIYKLLGLPDLASQHGADVDKLIVYVHYLMLALFVGWSAYFFLALLKFRKGKNPKADYAGVTGHASNYMELTVAVIEIVLLVGFAVPLWAKVVDVFPKPEENPVHVQVTAQQFNWMARYPGADGKFGKQDIKYVSGENPLGLLQKDPVAKANDPEGADDVSAAPNTEIVVPVDQPVIAHISSLDVIHSFKVTPLRVTQDAIPGLRIPIHFTATKTNLYQINCAQLCGNGHSSMKGWLRVASSNEFNAWLKSKVGAAQGFE
jgi:cytochrome c oxidase subunit II